MCTAATYQTRDFYFGRNLDYECSYGEQVVVVPRNFPFALRHGGELARHYAMIGMAHVAGGYPLFYDAVNEKGLCIAGLNFVGNAVYGKPQAGCENIAVFELIPWLLGRCANIAQARAALESLHLTDTPFSPQFPTAQLHWLLAARDGCLTVEATADGLHVYDNPAGVLTNNPPFPMQLFALNNYMQLTPLRRKTASACRSASIAGAWARWGCRATCVAVAFCPGGFYTAELPLWRGRGGEREPVFPHSRRGGAAERLLRAGGRKLRAHDLHELLQCRPRDLLLHDLW